MDGVMVDETVAIAGERLNGIQEVSGSIPLISTKKRTHVANKKGT